MVKSTPIELTKIKQLVVNIREFPAKIDTAELAKDARHLLKKYALLSEKIERNVLIGAEHQKDLASIRTKDFKAIRRTLKEKANIVLHGKNTKNAKVEKLAKKPVKAPTPKKASKAVGVKAVKETDSKKSVTKSSAKPPKATIPKEDV